MKNIERYFDNAEDALSGIKQEYEGLLSQISVALDEAENEPTFESSYDTLRRTIKRIIE